MRFPTILVLTLVRPCVAAPDDESKRADDVVITPRVVALAALAVLPGVPG